MNEERISLSAALSAFEDFTEDEFCEWIDSLLVALQSDPLLSVAPISPRLELGAEEIDSVLIGLYESLSRSRGYFADAIATLYGSTAYIEGYGERLYLLLQLMAVIKPRRARNLLRGHLLDEVAFSIEFSTTESSEHPQRHFVDRPEDLHTLLLSVVGEYSKDQTLLEYIQGSAARITYHPYLLVCFRLLASGGDKEGFDFLNLIIPHTHSSDEAATLILEVYEEIKRRTNYRQFCQWYAANAGELSSKWPQQFGLFEEAIRKRAFPDRIDLFDFSGDKHRVLVALQLFAPIVRYNSEQIVSIARLYKILGKELIIDALHNIWQRAKAVTADGEPWKFVTVSEFVVGGLQQSNKRAIEVITDTGEINQLRFDARQEPVLDEIFERINTVYLLGTDLEEIEQEFEDEWVEEDSMAVAAG